MKTSNQIEEDFRADLQILLTKHKVKIRAANHGWPVHDDDVRMTAIIHPEWNSESALVSEGARIDLGDLLEPFPPVELPPWEVSGWHPIETAPRDGTMVELLGENGNLDTGKWHEWGDGTPGEFSTENGEGPHTHWRPLTK